MSVSPSGVRGESSAGSAAHEAAEAAVHRIAVFGGSGRTGRVLLDAALRRGLTVQALYRPGSAPDQIPVGLNVLIGQLSNPDDVRNTLSGTDAVGCVFGPTRQEARAFCAEATRNVIAGMDELGIRRLVCQTGAMIGEEAANQSLAMRRMVRGYRRRYPELAEDRDRQEREVRGSDLDWVLVKPPRLTDGPSTGRLRAGPTWRVGLLSSVRRADVAEFLCGEVVRGRFHREAVYVIR